MYIVIFKARIKQVDQIYSQMAANLQTKAKQEYGCVHFESVCENGYEIALSYWHTLEDIKCWKNDPVHLQAQKTSKNNWYSDYSVTIAYTDNPDLTII